MRPPILISPIAALIILLSILPSCLAQGSLSPPGAPTPTMKTLQQVEPRTPLAPSQAGLTISQPGSYYLAGNITVTNNHGIVVNADNVTLDLNGFTVSSTKPSAAYMGILLNGTRAHIHILNGHIRGGVTNSGGVYAGSGFASGISYTTAPRNVRVSGVSVSGCQFVGINLGSDNSTVVESCTVRTVGSYGIYAASVSHSTAYECGSDAIFAGTASDCIGYCTGYGNGLFATTANNCVGSSVFGDGLYAYLTANNCYGRSESNDSSDHGLSATTANNCTGVSTGDGYGLFANPIANNCCGSSSGGTALSATIANNCYGSSSSGTGLNAVDIAIGCWGASTSGTGLSAYIANSCRGFGPTPLNVTYKYNMP